MYIFSIFIAFVNQSFEYFLCYNFENKSRTKLPIKRSFLISSNIHFNTQNTKKRVLYIAYNVIVYIISRSSRKKYDLYESVRPGMFESIISQLIMLNDREINLVKRKLLISDMQINFFNQLVINLS